MRKIAVEAPPNHILPVMLEAAVPLRIREIAKRGGPTDRDYEEARAFAQLLAEKGDVLMFGGKTKGEPARLFNQLALALAVMAFCPGGVTVFGRRWVYVKREML